MSVPRVEICVDDVAGVIAARDGGADRVELCEDLSCGGVTPPCEWIDEAIEYAPDGGLQILVRPRGGDFVYTPDEVEDIVRTIRAMRLFTEGVRVPVGFVVGALHPDRSINCDAALKFADEAEGRPLTFHRAFDCVLNQEQGIDDLIACAYDRVLTTGGHPTVADASHLRRRQEQAGDRLIILGSGGLRASNVAEVARYAKLREVHMRTPGADGHTDVEQVRAVMRVLAQG